MLAESYNNIQKLIKYSTQLHKNQIKIIKEYLLKEKTNYEKWCELIYSILVGSQIRTDKAKYCYNQLLDEYFDLLNPNFLKDVIDFSYLKELVEKSLKENGYRFYKSKSDTIYNVILYFKDYSFEITNFLDKFKNYKLARKELMKIAGIGYKIASHWLRNMGYQIPVIDLHIKNILYKFRILDKEKISYLAYEKIQNMVIEELKLDNISFDLALWYYGKNICSNRVRCLTCKFRSVCKA